MPTLPWISWIQTQAVRSVLKTLLPAETSSWPLEHNFLNSSYILDINPLLGDIKGCDGVLIDFIIGMRLIFSLILPSVNG